MCRHMPCKNITACGSSCKRLASTRGAVSDFLEYRTVDELKTEAVQRFEPNVTKRTKPSQVVFLTNAPLGNQYMLRNCPRRKPDLKRRPGGGKLGYDAISSIFNLNKYCSLRLLYSWKVLASLKAWCKLWLSRFRWNVTVSRRVRGGGGWGEALCYFASTGYALNRVQVFRVTVWCL